MENQLAELKKEIEELKIQNQHQNLLLTLLPMVLGEDQRAKFAVLIKDFIQKSQKQLPEQLVRFLGAYLQVLEKAEQSHE